jgi:hypothetical protein
LRSLAGRGESGVLPEVDGDVVNDGIGFHGHGGEQSLRDRHTDWAVGGFELISSGPDY